jgi:hypothetical protein
MASKRIAEIEQSYGVTVPERLRRFFAEKQAPTRKHLKLQAGYLRGRFQVDFDDASLLDLNELGENLNIDAIMAGGDLDGAWKDTYGDCVPFATLADAAAEGEDDADGGDYNPVKGFLVVDTSHEECPVLLFDYECSLYPVADSLDGFLRGEPPTRKERFEREHVSWNCRYKKLSWADPTEKDGDNDYPNEW